MADPVASPMSGVDGAVIGRLFDTILSRQGADPQTSYTAKLLSRGPVQCAKKFGEEAVEAALAGALKDKAGLISESADVLYHLLVLWAASGVTPAEVYTALSAREGRSGIDEKKSRGA